MITVMDLISHPVFNEFHLAAGERGLNNAVSGTGIFEWESSDDLDRTFSEGEFVITTLSQAKNDVSAAENFLKLLIQRRVSAIGIKRVYFQEISEEIEAYADAWGVPIFFFSETYFDDIIYTIKNALVLQPMEPDYESKVRLLLNPALDGDMVLKTAREINPRFFHQCICCFASGSKNDVVANQDIHPISQGFVDGDPLNHTNPKDTAWAVIPYQGAILVIYTGNGNFQPADFRVNFIKFLQEKGIENHDFRIGVSRVHDKLDSLARAVQESLYANASCIIDNETLVFFDASGLDRLLMPIRRDSWAKQYYESLLEKITTHDETHNSKLMETLVEYVKSNGDIKLTAKKCFQHSNTIRYRLEKAKKILNIEENMDSYPEIYVFIRFYQISKILDLS